MKFGAFALVAPLLVGASLAHAGMESVFDGGWRISAGAAYDSGVKTDLNFTPRQSYVSPFSRSAGALTRQQAKEAAHGKTVGTKTTYVNTRKGDAQSYIDVDDPGFAHDGNTFNYNFPSAVWDENTAFELGYATYEEIQTHEAASASMNSYASDEAAMPGVFVQLSRNLYHNEEYGWGLEAAFGVQYAKRNNVIKSASNWFIGRSSKQTGGFKSTYTSKGELAEILPGSTENADINDVVWGEDNALGGDWFEIDPNDVVESEWGSSASDEQYGSLEARGDYENLELMLLLQPYYDIFDWFSINATLGLVVSRQDMEMSFAMMRNRVVEYSSNRDFSQWDVYGVAGLGVMFYYRGFTLSGDFLARLWARDMDIEDRYYHGTVGRGDWMFRLALGYEF